MKDTDLVSVSLLETLDNVWPPHMFTISKYIIYAKKKKKNRIAKTRLIKVKSVEDEEIIMAMAKIIITTVRMKIIIIIMMIMRIKIGNQMKI